MTALSRLPEIAELDAPSALVRIPPDVNVPLTPRVRRLIDTAAFRRLARISQLGLVSLVYPAALHTRFEHSLGVYRLALRFLRRLSCDGRFAALIRREDAELLLCAALLHDIGHWPFCHPIEDIRLPGVPVHEQFAERFIAQGEVAEVLQNDWGIEPVAVLSLLDNPAADDRSRILSSILSGPIDIDKMDYLFRDSLHSGVPYGRNFDQERLIGSLCLNEPGDALAINDKGKTAAELMVFARYVMFSEVYWHHAVRSATAMLQRAFYRVYAQLDLVALFRKSEAEMIDALVAATANTSAAPLVDGLFGPRRQIHKRLAEYSVFQESAVYERLARRGYVWLVRCAEELAGRFAAVLGEPVSPEDVLIDAPPVGREIEFRVDVFYAKERRYRPLGDVSPVVQALAQRQFDDYVKQVRVFVHPRLREALRRREDLAELVLGAAADVDAA
ncbi:MAG: metal-dependent phosphohydrolase [Planctomycetota bacterium]|nr:MAG: metal-dependent phosphohydrolase [Planctomycetota bacterium]